MLLRTGFQFANLKYPGPQSSAAMTGDQKKASAGKYLQNTGGVSDGGLSRKTTVQIIKATFGSDDSRRYQLKK
jgi:hypothetical protein